MYYVYCITCNISRVMYYVMCVAFRVITRCAARLGIHLIHSTPTRMKLEALNVEAVEGQVWSSIISGERTPCQAHNSIPSLHTSLHAPLPHSSASMRGSSGYEGVIKRRKGWVATIDGSEIGQVFDDPYDAAKFLAKHLQRETPVRLPFTTRTSSVLQGHVAELLVVLRTVPPHHQLDVVGTALVQLMEGRVVAAGLPPPPAPNDGIDAKDDDSKAEADSKETPSPTSPRRTSSTSTASGPLTSSDSTKSDDTDGAGATNRPMNARTAARHQVVTKFYRSLWVNGAEGWLTSSSTDLYELFIEEEYFRITGETLVPPHVTEDMVINTVRKRCVDLYDFMEQQAFTTILRRVAGVTAPMTVARGRETGALQRHWTLTGANCPADLSEEWHTLVAQKAERREQRERDRVAANAEALRLALEAYEEDKAQAPDRWWRDREEHRAARQQRDRETQRH